MRPLLMLFGGPRSARLADLCNPLLRVADVAVVTTEQTLAGRPEALDELAGVRRVVVAQRREDLLDAALRFARTEPVAGALSFSEDLVELAARVAAAVGLPGQPVATLPQLRDKYAQRRALSAAGIPVPPYHLLGGPDDAAAALRAVPLPAILKPTVGSGSAFSYPIAAPGELAPALAEAFGRADAGGHRRFILEGLLIGQDRHPCPGFAPYVSVESLAGGGRLVHLAVTDRFPLAPPALETGMMLPSCLGADQRAEVVAAADAALRALDFQHGAAHTELMLTAAGPRVIEVNARAGGALPYLFPLVSDLDLVEQAGRLALGLELDSPAGRDLDYRGQGVFLGPQHPVGVEVLDVSGLDAVAALPEVRQLIPLAVAGTRTDGFQQTLIAAILAVTGTPQQAVRLWQDVMRLVRCEYRPSPATHAAAAF